MSTEDYYEDGWINIPTKPIDHKAIHDGFRYFWNNYQITGSSGIKTENMSVMRRET